MSDEISKQDLDEFFAGLDSFLAGVSAVAKSCPDVDNCGTHYRNNVREEAGGFSVRITYAGEYALYSFAVIDNKGTCYVRTEFYKVGGGVIGSLPWNMATEKLGQDVNGVHEHYLKHLNDINDL